MSQVPSGPPSRSGPIDRAKNWLRLASVGAFGILAALIADLQNRGDSSALFVVARFLVYAGGLVGLTAVPLYATILILMGLGAAVVLYFKPNGIRAAFAQGFGTLAAVMTLVPQDTADAIGSPLEELQEGVAPVIREVDDAIALGVPEPRIVPAVYAPQRSADEVDEVLPPDEARTIERPPGYSVRVRVDFPGGVPEPIALKIRQGQLKSRLFNPATSRAYNLFLSAGGPIIKDGDSLLIRTYIPSEAEEATLMLRVESDGFEIAVSEHTVTQGPNELWDVEMVPTSEPLLLQRLKHSYAF